MADNIANRRSSPLRAKRRVQPAKLKRRRYLRANSFSGSHSRKSLNPPSFSIIACFTLRDVRRNQWRSLTTDETIQAALDWLEDEDWLRSEPSGGTGPGSGRRTLRYRIHPAIKGKRKGGDA